MKNSSLLIAALALTASTASAALITGGIIYDSQFRLLDASDMVVSSFTDGVKITFTDPGADDELGTADDGAAFDTDVDLAEGDFAIYQDSEDLVLTDFVYNPLAVTDPGANPHWELNGFAFTVTEASIVNLTPSFLNISGMGIITADGFEDTIATWTFTSTSSSSATLKIGGGTTAAIPEPSTVIALISGAMIAGLVALRIRRKR